VPPRCPRYIPDRSGHAWLNRETSFRMTKKAIYRHKKTGALFSIETDEDGKVVSSAKLV